MDLIDGRAYVSLLLETTQALVRIDEIVRVEGVDEISIGLNDLHRALGLSLGLLRNHLLRLLRGSKVARAI